MIGCNEEELRKRIIVKGLALIQPYEVPDEQQHLHAIIVDRIEERAVKLARAMIEAILANNNKIEEDFRKAGVTIKNESLPSD